MNNYIFEIDIKNPRTRCEICSKILLFCIVDFEHALACWVVIFIFIVWTIFFILIIFIVSMIFRKIGIWCTLWNYHNGESHINFCMQCVKMTLSGGGLSLMAFWNNYSCITIFFSYSYLIINGKRSFINKESS